MVGSAKRSSGSSARRPSDTRPILWITRGCSASPRWRGLRAGRRSAQGEARVVLVAALDSSCRVSRTVSTSPRASETRRSSSARVSTAAPRASSFSAGVRDLAVGGEPLHPTAREQHLVLGQPRPEPPRRARWPGHRRPPGSGRRSTSGVCLRPRAPRASAFKISARPWTSRRSSDRYSRSARHSSRRARRSSRLSSAMPTRNVASRILSMRRLPGARGHGRHPIVTRRITEPSSRRSGCRRPRDG